jgi:hypothetical protein
VRTIVNTVLSHAKFKRYSTMFSQVAWNEYQEATRAFKKLIQLLEQEIMES